MEFETVTSYSNSDRRKNGIRVYEREKETRGKGKSHDSQTIRFGVGGIEFETSILYM